MSEHREPNLDLSQLNSATPNNTAVLLAFRALDVDVDNPHTGRASLVAIAKAAGVTSPLVNYEQVSYLV